MIRFSPVRVIGPDNEQIGVIETPEALRMAQDQGLDLVEVVSDSRPPVCKIMDYGRHKYEQSKKETKGSSKASELKEIRLGRSTKIDPHDVQIRIDQARRFLMDGHKVQVTQRFRGREIVHRQLGMNNLTRFVKALDDISKVEMEPRSAGRQVSLMLAPDRNRIESLKRSMADKAANEAAKQAAEQEAAEEAARLEAERLAAAGGGQNATVESKPDQPKKKKKKPSGDQRQSNPVDDEMNALLGE